MRSRAAAAALALLLGACATAPPQPLPDLSGVPASFEVTGRLALRQGQRSDIAKLRWTHRRASDLWVISSPLGNEVARIESGPSGATLTQAGGGGVQADSFAELTDRALGIELDPAMLARWLHGGAPSEATGWKVTVEETQKAGAVDIARRMSATRGEVVVRLVVDEYRVLGD
jgi:outer membrane lipoprotein LolB